MAILNIEIQKTVITFVTINTEDYIEGNSVLGVHEWINELKFDTDKFVDSFEKELKSSDFHQNKETKVVSITEEK